MSPGSIPGVSTSRKTSAGCLCYAVPQSAWSRIGSCRIVLGSLALSARLLVYRSRFLPRFLGVFYMYTQPAVFGEIVFMLWLLIKGATPPALAPSSPRGCIDCIARKEAANL